MFIDDEFSTKSFLVSKHTTDFYAMDKYSIDGHFSAITGPIIDRVSFKGIILIRQRTRIIIVP